MTDDQTVTPIKPKTDKVDRRHPITVTIERLSDHVQAYSDDITPRELKQMTELVKLLDRVFDRVTAGDGQ